MRCWKAGSGAGPCRALVTEGVGLRGQTSLPIPARDDARTMARLLLRGERSDCAVASKRGTSKSHQNRRTVDMQKGIREFGACGVIILALVAILASPSTAAAQEPLGAKDMEALVAKASTPADHARLREHYLNMVAIYSADADAHAAMAKASRRHSKTANQPASGDPAAQMERIAQRARDAAATARELATYHEGLAAGAPKSQGKTPARHPALPMAQVEVVALIETARTPAEHRRLSQQFAAEAARYTADAETHAAMAAGYRANPRLREGDPAVHCDRFVQQVKEAATAARELASYHERVAAEAGE